MPNPKPTDYKAEARECAAQIDRATCPASHGEDWAMGLCIECFIAPLAALLERLCGEAREAERKLHEPRIIQSPGFHIDPEDEA